MSASAQSAIRGVFSVGALNTLARLVAYGKHLVITAYIGLSIELDAFYMAAAIVAIAVYTFGDVFDSVGVPRLVEKRQSGGDEAFLRLTGSIFTLSMLLSVLLTGVVLAIAPLAGRIAPGYTPDKARLILESLYRMIPVCLIYLPYHAVGSFLRARRRFQAFYVGELLIALVTLAVVYLFRESPFIIPISFSAGYCAAFCYVVVAARSSFRASGDLRGDDMREIVGMLFRLIPLYAVGQMFGLVDKVFASFLPVGGVSALSYGLLIAGIPVSILMLENVFITPLSESADRQSLMEKIVAGILIISLPIAVFVSYYAAEIVRAAFQRGLFTQMSTDMTAQALRYFALAVPALFLVPISYRMLQILRKIEWLVVMGMATVAVNAVLNYFFLKMGLGIGGLALATAIAYCLLALGSVALLSRCGIRIFPPGVVRVLLASLAVSLVALLATAAVPLGGDTPWGIGILALVFLATAGACYSVVPVDGIREWRRTVAAGLFSRNG